MTFADALRSGVARLNAGWVEAADENLAEAAGEAWMEARLLLAWASGRNSAWLMAHLEESPEDRVMCKFLEAITRRARREPVAYILGEAGFYGRIFEVTPDVLIPRPETEQLIAVILSWLKSRMTAAGVPSLPLRLLEIGTGSGCIPISLLAEYEALEATTVDISSAALAVARRNAELHGVAGRITFLEADFLQLPPDMFSEQFDVLVSNPPYIPTEVVSRLMPDVLLHEPLIALDGGADGQVFYRLLATRAKVWLKVGGLLAVEIGYNQGDCVCRLFREAGWEPVLSQDLENRDRVVRAIR